MRRLIMILMFIICSGLIGCSAVSKPTTEEIINAKQAQLEPPTNYEQAVKDYWRPRLVDPTAPIYEFYGTPRKGYATGGVLAKRDITFGWVISYSINSKNRMGGYTGSELRRALIVNNVVVKESYDFSQGALPSDNFIEYLD